MESANTTTIEIEVTDQTLVPRKLNIEDPKPTGEQLARLAGIRPVRSAIVLQILPNGYLEDIRPEEIVDLKKTEKKFLIVQSDRTYRFVIEGERLDWPCSVISGGQIRKIKGIAPELDIYLERSELPDLLIADIELVHLDGTEVESFITKKSVWELNVQGVVLELPTDSINTREALVKAGFDPGSPWHIYLKVKGEPKKEIDLSFVIDLRTPGIEKVRLTPKEINNGEELLALRREFKLIESDEMYLNRLGIAWETAQSEGRRWLIIHNYPVSQEFTTGEILLALEVPPLYPGAQLYGFYSYPPLTLKSGKGIESTQLRAVIDGVEFHGWSRRKASDWDPKKDNIITHIAMVEGALATAVGE